MPPWSLRILGLSLAFQAQFLFPAHPRDERIGAANASERLRIFSQADDLELRGMPCPTATRGRRCGPEARATCRARLYSTPKSCTDSTCCAKLGRLTPTKLLRVR